MPLELQAKLLRVLQSGEVTSVGGRRPEHVDVRIVAATHRDLDAAVRDGRFREDLLYRLRVVPIHIPALRERAEDVAVLAQHFVERYAEELRLGPRALSPDALERLVAHPWPGNVRELENAIKRALVLSTGEVLTPDAFAFLAVPAGEAHAATGARARGPRRARGRRRARGGRARPPRGAPAAPRAPAPRARPRPHRRQPAPRGGAPRHQPQHAAQEADRAGHRRARAPVSRG